MSGASTSRRLSDGELLAEIQVAAAAERHATAHLIALLIELDSRRLYLGEGYSSLFTYCTQALRLSEHAAYNRIEAARVARRFPVVLDLVEQGAATVTAVRLLAPHLTPENHRDVLNRARHKSKREIEMLVVALAPRPDVPAVVRKLPVRIDASTHALAPAAAGAVVNEGTAAKNIPLSAAILNDASMALVARCTPRANHDEALKPLAPERYKIQFTIGRETHDKLRRAQDLLRHVIPDGDLAAIFDRALDVLVGQLDRRKTGAAARPRASCQMKTGSRHVPASVKRAVWQRDGGQCAFRGVNGRCSETGFLEYHHVVPFASGGTTSTANLELRCRAHNQHEAEEWFGALREPAG